MACSTCLVVNVFLKKYLFSFPSNMLNYTRDANIRQQKSCCECQFCQWPQQRYWRVKAGADEMTLFYLSIQSFHFLADILSPGVNVINFFFFLNDQCLCRDWLVTLLCLLFRSGGMPVLLACPLVKPLLPCQPSP